MNFDVPFQNQEQSEVNPLKNEVPVASKKIVIELKKIQAKVIEAFGSKDPKIKALVILSAVVVVLLILSVFASIFRSTKSLVSNIQPTPTVTYNPSPTDTPQNINNIPPELKGKFDQIDNLNQTDISFPPPQIDNTIGN